MKFRKPILVYMPCHNCEGSIVEVLSNIPHELQDQIECLVIDNQSTDCTSKLVLEEIRKNRKRFRINLIRTKENIGYSGSQKLAYFLACKSPDVKYVIMLHGDGQYPPSLLINLTAYIKKDYSIVNGYRFKPAFGHQEETPLVTYYVIKILSLVESYITGYMQNEWHSGFVMYSTDFLRRIPLQYLSDTRHIDGEFLICAGILMENTLAVPIYKRYKHYEGLGGISRIKYVLNVFRIILKFKRQYYHRMLKTEAVSKIDYEFDISTQKLRPLQNAPFCPIER